ncbi:MAG: general secretion pathway protein GspB [Nitrospiraceae bacterium]|nr:general secretion pathway protein GspB [Nitrospiraceae bacterium]
MSYILDALRKSEQERKRGTVPDPLTVQEQVVQSPRKRVPRWYAVIPLAVIAVVVGGWLSVHHFNGGRGLPPALEVKDARPPAGGMRPGDSAAEYGGLNSAPTSLPSSGQVARSSRTAEPQRVEQPKIISVREPAAREAVKRELPPQRVVRRAPEPAVAEAPAGIDRPVSIPPADPGKIYRLGDLPPALQKGLPPVVLTAFMYSTNPASRVVRINDRMMREGQELAQGVRLLEITPEGVVLSSGGYRFFVAMK